MRSVAALAALLVAVSGAAASPAEVPVPADEVRALTAGAADVRRALYAEVHATEPGSADYVNVTLFGGLPPSSRFTMYLVPTGEGLFRAEIVTQAPVYKGKPKPTRRAVFSIGREASGKIASLLASPALWAEPVGRSGGCTDQADVVLEVVWKGKRREAIRLACAPTDQTESLIDIALSQAANH